MVRHRSFATQVEGYMGFEEASLLLCPSTGFFHSHSWM